MQLTESIILALMPSTCLGVRLTRTLDPQVVVFFGEQQCLGQRYGLKTLSTTRKPPFLTKFGLRLQVQASGFELTTPILEAACSNH